MTSINLIVILYEHQWKNQFCILLCALCSWVARSEFPISFAVSCSSFLSILLCRDRFCFLVVVSFCFVLTPDGAVDLLISLASSQFFPLAWPRSFLGPCRRFPCNEHACVWLDPRASVAVLSGDFPPPDSFSRHPGFSMKGFYFSWFLRLQRRPLLPFWSRPAPVTTEFFHFSHSKSSVPRQRFAGSSTLPLDFSLPEPALCLSLSHAWFPLLQSALLGFVPRPRGSDIGAASFLQSPCWVCPSALICFVRQAVA
jgi:hypothetical protein